MSLCARSLGSKFCRKGGLFLVVPPGRLNRECTFVATSVKLGPAPSPASDILLNIKPHKTSEPVNSKFGSALMTANRDCVAPYKLLQAVGDDRLYTNKVQLQPQEDLEHPSMEHVSCQSNVEKPDQAGDHQPPTMPTEDQLENIKEILAEELPKMLNIGYLASRLAPMFNENLVVINNIRGTKTVGVYHHVVFLSLLRIVAFFKYASVRFIILKITSHTSDGTVRCRWSIRGISGVSVFMFWKWNAIKMFKEDLVKEAPIWHDGFSTYYVGPDGLVNKLIIDKMQPDDDKIKDGKDVIASKLAMFVKSPPVMKFGNSGLAKGLFPFMKVT